MAKSPDAFRTIGEVSEWLDTPTHVIRFWESRFEEINPVQKEGGRRYFRPNDLLIMGGLKKLLHDDGLTIKAAQKLIVDDGVQAVMDLSPPIPDTDGPEGPENAAVDDSEPDILVLSEPAKSPEQKPMLLVAPNEILEPSHKWHMKVSPGAPKDALEAALTSLSELRSKLSAQISD